MKAQLGILATALSLAILAASAVSSSAAPLAQDDSSSSPGARERWERLSHEEKARMKERFERFQKMGAQERRELEDRHRKLKRTRRRVESDLSPEMRERLSKLTDRAHREIVGELVEEELRAEGRRLRTKLPDSLRERFERASPEQRQRFFVEFKQKTLPRMSLRAITELAGALELDREEVRRIKALPPRERVEMVFELRKRIEAKAVERDGLPEGLSRGRWEELVSLSPREFYEVAMRLDRRAHDAAPMDPERIRALPKAERRRRAADRILHAMRASPEEHLDLAHLSPQERRAQVEHRRRQRVMEIIRLHEAFAPEKLARIEAMSDGEFFSDVRRLLHEVGPARHRRPHPQRDRPSHDVLPGESRDVPREGPRPGQRPGSPRDQRPPARGEPLRGRGATPVRPRPDPRERERPVDRPSDGSGEGGARRGRYRPGHDSSRRS